MAQLTKADLFNKPWPKPVKVEIDVPELSGELYVRILSKADCNRLSEQSVKMVDGDAHPKFSGADELLVAMCACDENGTRIFEDDDAEEIERKPGFWVEAIVAAAKEANFLTAKAKATAKKNSSTTLSVSSSSN